MIELPQDAKITLRRLKLWNKHSQQEFNKLDKRMLDYVKMYCIQYIDRILKVNKVLEPNTAKVLASIDNKVHQAIKFNNYR